MNVENTRARNKCLITEKKHRLTKGLQRLSVTAPYVYSTPYTLRSLEQCVYLLKKKYKNIKLELDFTEYKKYVEFMARKKSKMGRPPLKAKNRRTALVSLRLKPSDRDKLEEEAKAKGLSLSSYLLQCWQKVRTEK